MALPQVQARERKKKEKKAAIHVFDEPYQKANDWIRSILEESGWTHSQAAYSALRAVLHALRDRLPPEEVLDFASELPMMLQGMFIEGWKLADKPDKSIKTKEDFLNRVRRHFGPEPTIDAEEIVSVVFNVISRRITSGEIRQVRMSLPEHIRELWPEAWILDSEAAKSMETSSRAQELKVSGEKTSPREIRETQSESTLIEVDPTYENWLNEVSRLAFIGNRIRADHCLKAVLGTLASRVDEFRARELTSQLPGPLTFERLRGHQIRDLSIAADQFAVQIARQFQITVKESTQLIETIFDLMKREVGPQVTRDLEALLPSDWRSAVETA